MQHRIVDLQHTLKGFSGCGLEVLRSGDTSFVRKTAGTLKQNDKIRAEFKKLERLNIIGRETGLFRVPETYGQGFQSNGLTYYDLEFIPAWELDSRLHALPPHRIKELAKQLLDIINEFAGRPSIKTGHDSEPGEHFVLSKFQETARSIRNTAAPPLVRKLTAEYIDLVSSLTIAPEDVIQTCSFCHGDLALDNVLLNRSDKLYLLDPLVNGHESYIWDIAKVFQSCFVHWRSIKHCQFTIDPRARRILLPPDERMSLFHLAFSDLAANVFAPSTITLYLAATVARAAKYWKTYQQFCALLMIANELLDSYMKQRCDFNESLSSLRW